MKRKSLVLFLILVFLTGCTRQQAKKSMTEEKTLPLVETDTLFHERKTYPLKETKIEIDFFEELKKEMSAGCVMIGALDHTIYVAVSDTEHSECYLSYDLNTKQWKKLFSRGTEQDVFFTAMYQDSILIGNGFWDEADQLNYTITQHTGEKEKIVASGVSNGFPDALVVDHSLVVNESVSDGSGKLKSIVKVIDLESLQEETVYQGTYTQRGNEVFTGDMVVCIGEWKDGFCYNQMTMKKERLMDLHAGQSALYYYSFATHTSKKLMDFPTNLLYMSGTPDFLITSDYSIGNEEIGRLIVKEKGQYSAYLLPGVIPGEDISDALQITDDLYFVDQGDYYYIVDVKAREYSKGNQKKLVKGMYYHYGWVKTDHGVMCTTCSESGITLHKYQL